jgi:phosphoribosyl-ATP pyrophosphohydrolase
MTMSNAGTDLFDRLFGVIAQRKASADPETSYVARLMHKGTAKINAKITEEAAEVCEAALEEGTEHLTAEICDLLFHVFVLCGHREIPLEDIRNELGRRFGVSGIDEKRSRANYDPAKED